MTSKALDIETLTSVAGNLSLSKLNMIKFLVIKNYLSTNQNNLY